MALAASGNIVSPMQVANSAIRMRYSGVVGCLSPTVGPEPAVVQADAAHGPGSSKFPATRDPASHRDAREVMMTERVSDIN